MKKLTALILTFTMLLSIFAIPMGATAAEISEEQRLEILAEKTSQYLDITKVTDAYVKGGYGYIAQDLYMKALQAGISFERKDSDPLFSRLMNSNYWTNLSIAGGAKNMALVESSMMVKLYDLTNGINNGTLTLNSVENVTGTVGVEDAETGLWSLESANYDVYTYLYKGEKGIYKIGPVAAPNKDAEGNWGGDVYSTDGAVVLIGGKDTDKDGIMLAKNITRDPYTYEYISTTSSESQNSAVLKNVNASAEYVNILMQTFSIEGDAVLVPVKVNYTSGSTTKYALETEAKTDIMSKIIAVPANEDGAEHTQAQLDEFYKSKASYYLTDEKKAELGISDLTIKDATFANADIVVPNVEIIGKETNRNAAQTTTTADGVATTKITKVNYADSDFRVSDIAIPVDATKTISSIEISGFYVPALEGIIKSATSNRFFLPLTFDGYEGTEKFYIYLGRQCQGRNNLFAMSLSGKSLQDKIDAMNATLSALDSEVLTLEDVANYKAQIAAVKAESAYILDSDFDMSKLTEAEERIAESERLAQHTDKSVYYYPIEYNRDVFFTFAEVLEYGVFDAKVNGAYVFPEKDLAGNPLDTVTPWFGYKGFIRSAPGNLDKGASGFLIDSIKGVEEKVTAQGYTSSTNDTVKTSSKKLVINGNPNFELESVSADGAENYIYNANGFKYKMGPIGGAAHRTADGGYNVRALQEGEILKFERVQEGAQKFGMLLALRQCNEGVSYAALQKVVIAHTDGTKETKYLVVTNMSQDAASDAATSYDGDRLGRLVVAVPKTVDQTTGSVLKANAQIVSEKNSLELIGKAITVDDVVFPSDFIVGESMPIADFGIGRNSAVTNGKRYCPGGYANHYEIDFGEDVADITYAGGISYAKSYPGAVLSSQVAYIPVEIPGASEDYLYYARFGRPCGYYTVLMGASSEGKSVAERIDSVNEELATAESEEEVLAALEAMKALIEANDGVVLEKDFETEAALTKLVAYIAEDVENATTIEEYKEINAKINEYVADYGIDASALKATIAGAFDALTLKANFAMTEANGANAKLFLDYATYQTYKSNKEVTEEFVPGLDYNGVANTSKESGYPSYPTGTDDTITAPSNALIYKVDQAPATGGQWSQSFVNFTTKNGEITWTVDGTEFAVNPYEKIVKVYTTTNTDNVADPDLKARFETLNNPVLDIEDGCYETITILTGSSVARNITPTIHYKDGDTKKLSSILLAKPVYNDGDNQDTGLTYMQALTNWGNTNLSGLHEFEVVTLTGYDTAKEIDKISFVSDGWSSPVFVLSAFGTTASLADILETADTTTYASVTKALASVDAILAENGITVSDLSEASRAKYDALVAAQEALGTLEIEEVALENNVVTINFVNKAPAAVNALVLVAQYNDDETELVSVKKYVAKFEKEATSLTQEVEVDANNKVKVFVWKDLVDFFPLYSK